MQLLTMDSLVVVLVASLIMIIRSILIVTYSKSPAWQNSARLTLALSLLSVLIIFMYLTRGIWDYIISASPATIDQLWIIFFLAMTCYLVSSVFISFVAYEKKGLIKLKRISEGGLVDGIIAAVIVTVIIGLMGGIAGGAIGITTSETLDKITGGVIYGLTIGLVFGLIGIVSGLFDEYRNIPEQRSLA